MLSGFQTSVTDLRGFSSLMVKKERAVPSLSFSVIVWSFICTRQQSRPPKQRKQYVESTTQRVSNLTFRQRWRSQLQMKMKKTFHDFILRQGTTYSFKVIGYIVLNTTSSGQQIVITYHVHHKQYTPFSSESSSQLSALF